MLLVTYHEHGRLVEVVGIAREDVARRLIHQRALQLGHRVVTWHVAPGDRIASVLLVAEVEAPDADTDRYYQIQSVELGAVERIR